MQTQVTNRSHTPLSRAGNVLLGLAVVGLLAACNDATGPGANTGRSVTLSFTLAGGSAVPAPSLFAQVLDLTDGQGNQLVIDGAELVLREIEFERINHPECAPEVDEDSCEKFETGPFHVTLPLDGSVTTDLEAVVDTGTYDEIEFDIHKLDESDPVDAALLDFYPNMTDISIRVTGTYNGQQFLFTSDLNEEQEIELVDPLVVTPASGAINVTLELDLSTWFRTVGGTLVDPRTANKGQPNEQMVEGNIKASIEGFRDDDHDGVPHSDDPDEDNS